MVNAPESNLRWASVCSLQSRAEAATAVASACWARTIAAQESSAATEGVSAPAGLVLVLVELGVVALAAPLALAVLGDVPLALAVLLEDGPLRGEPSGDVLLDDVVVAAAPLAGGPASPRFITAYPPPTANAATSRTPAPMTTGCLALPLCRAMQ